MKDLYKYITLSLLAASSIPGICEVRLPHLFADGMVVQRDCPLKLWGTAAPGETVTVKVDKGKKSTTVAGADGQWRLSLPALKPGGPHIITVNDVVLNDVLSGDVLLFSGQSNMELPLARVTDMFAEEIAAYNNADIRQFKVPNVIDFHSPQEDVEGEWEELNQENVMNFSALAYFTAKALNRQAGLPVGIINASWGGTPIEAWISEDFLTDFPQALNEKRIYEDDGYRDRIKRLEGENFARWNATMWATDPGMQAEVKWYAPSLDDSSWALVDLISGKYTDEKTKGEFGSDSWNADGVNPVNGSHWLRKNVELPASMAGKEGMLRLGCIVDADSVYVNGKLVGTTGYQYPPRKYEIPEGLLREGSNNVTVRLISQNGTPHFVAEKPYKIIAGGDTVSLEGDWRYHLGSKMPHSPGMEFYCYKPTVLYNAMISPIIKYPVKGAVWYQGESNVSRRNEYAKLLKTMIANWREASGDDSMPFYIVELADYLHPSDINGRTAWAEMRKMQAKAAEETPGAELIRNSDLGEWNDIHPLDKKTLGNRVADAILRQTNNATK